MFSQCQNFRVGGVKCEFIYSAARCNKIKILTILVIQKIVSGSSDLLAWRFVNMTKSINEITNNNKHGNHVSIVSSKHREKSGKAFDCHVNCPFY